MGRRPLTPNGSGAEGSTLVKDKLIEAIALEMAEGTWRPFKSVRELAARQGISLTNAQRYCAEATRLLRLSWGQDEAKVAVLERIAQIGRAAETRTEEALDATGQVHELRKPDHRTALQAAKHLADILGLSGANSEVVVRYQQMSDLELMKETTRFIARLQEGNTHDGIETSGEAVPEGTGDELEPEDQAALDRLGSAGERRQR
ncbi:MAG TPA: hypothetical protein VER04_24400 [Polyangiaceae bacterium]|nr:hypothetical protein [Polyangiaceae bacterium]